MTLINSRRSANFSFLTIILVLLTIVSTATVSNATTFIVTKTADTNDSICDSDCSLREAISSANAMSSDDVINFGGSTFATAQTITLSGTQLQINNNGALTINGTGANLLTVSGNNMSRVFSIDAFANVTIGGVKITGGNFSSAQGSAFYNTGNLTLNNSIVAENISRTNSGEVIFNDGMNSVFTLNNSAVSGNTGNGIFNFNGIVSINNSFVNNNTGINGAGILNVRGSLNLNNSTISNNSAGSGGGIGGGIYNSSGTIMAINSTISNNKATLGGAGISNDSGTLTFVNSFITGNTLSNGFAGGGISNFNGAVTFTDSTISNNSVCNGCVGAGVSNSGSSGIFNLTRVTINNNSASFAGGIYNQGSGTVNLTNSTVSNNSANNGAGIGIGSGVVNLTNTTVANNATTGLFSEAGGISLGVGTLNLTNATIVNNTTGANGGGGIRNGSGTATGTINARNSIIADNSAKGSVAQDVSGALTSQGCNLIENTSGATIIGIMICDITGQDPQLLPLGDYGGATQTVALKPTSPAIDMGNNAIAANTGLTTDQRGMPRFIDGDWNGTTTVDIGVYELQTLPPNPTDCTFSISPNSQNFPTIGGSSTIVVNTQQGCNYSVSYDADYLMVGYTNGDLSLTVAANMGAARTAQIIISGQIFTVNQAGSKSRKKVRFF